MSGDDLLVNIKLKLEVKLCLKLKGFFRFNFRGLG